MVSEEALCVVSLLLHCSPIFLSKSCQKGGTQTMDLCLWNNCQCHYKKIHTSFFSSFKTPNVIFCVSKLLDSFRTISLARRLSRIYIEINNFALTAFHFSRFPLSWKKNRKVIFFLPFESNFCFQLEFRLPVSSRNDCIKLMLEQKLCHGFFSRYCRYTI